MAIVCKKPVTKSERLNLTAKNYKENTAEGFRNQSRNMWDLTKVESRQVTKSLVLSFLRIIPEIQGNEDEMDRY